MNAKEFFDHITSHMSAEDALLKLLEGHLLTYEKLKFQEGEEIHPIMLISMAAIDMGWSMAIPEGKEDEEVYGMVVGTQEYLDEIFPDNNESGCGCKNGCSASNCQNR